MLISYISITLIYISVPLRVLAPKIKLNCPSNITFTSQGNLLDSLPCHFLLKKKKNDIELQSQRISLPEFFDIISFKYVQLFS